MARTRLRGLEVGGIQIGIEVPKTCAWRWPDDEFEEFSLPPREPEVHVGVRVGRVCGDEIGGERYSTGDWTFEVGRRGEDWLLALSRSGRREQIAIFDRDFTAGEIVMSGEFVAEGGYPLRSPLDEWIVMHRNLARGGLCLNARAFADRGGVRVRVGHPTPRVEQDGSRWQTPRPGRQTLWVRAEQGEPRVYRTPWGDAMDRQLGREARVVEFDVREDTALEYRERLDPNDAAELLVMHAVVPLCDEIWLERVLQNARRLSAKVPFRRVGESGPHPHGTDWSSRPMSARAELRHGFA